MTLEVQLPHELDDAIGGLRPAMSAAAREAALVEAYRRSAISPSELRSALNISRLDLDAVLKRHGVVEDLMTVEEFENDLAAARQLSTKIGKQP